jgi:hypothetical protein
MRTTLDIDDDVLNIARIIARSENKSMGTVVSEFARKAISQGSAVQAVGFASESDLEVQLKTFGLVPFRATSGVLSTNERVNTIREEESI